MEDQSEHLNLELVEFIKPLRSPCSSYNIVTKSNFEHLMFF